MRILMIIDGLPGGGAEKVVLTLCQGMQQMGHSVSLFSLAKKCDYAIPEGVNYQVVLSDSRKPWRKLTELTRRANALDQAMIIEQQRRGDFDLVFSSLHKTDRIVARCRSINPAKLWFCIHGILSTSYLGHRKGLDRWLKRRKMASIYQGKNIVAVSQAISDDLQNHIGVTPANIAVINNPFDIKRLLQQADEPCEREGSDYLVHVGRFHSTKRHDRLIKAYALSGIQAPLILLGTGSDAQLAQAKELAARLGVAERVVFAGFQANPFPWIKHARLLVLSSDSEGFGNVLVEAMLCGTPVVSTRCPGGPAEILHNAGLEQALAEMNEQSLAEKMALIWQHPPVINQQALADYDIDPICQQYLALSQTR